jgi:hypothetical protein
MRLLNGLSLILLMVSLICRLITGGRHCIRAVSALLTESIEKRFEGSVDLICTTRVRHCCEL